MQLSLVRVPLLGLQDQHLPGIRWVGLSSVCYTEKATPAWHRPERQHNARTNRRKQGSPNETKPYSNPTPPRKRQNTPTNGHTPRCMKPTHTRTQKCALTRPLTRRVTTQYLHTQNATTRRRSGRNDNQDSPRELQGHRANGTAADQSESNESEGGGRGGVTGVGEGGGRGRGGGAVRSFQRALCTSGL